MSKEKMCGRLGGQNLWLLNFRESYFRADACLQMNTAIALGVLDFVAKQCAAV